MNDEGPGKFHLRRIEAPAGRTTWLVVGDDADECWQHPASGVEIVLWKELKEARRLLAWLVKIPCSDPALKCTKTWLSKFERSHYR